MTVTLNGDDVMKWQPIETAPRDGTPVLLWGVVAGEISGQTDKMEFAGEGEWVEDSQYNADEDWWLLSGGDYYSSWCKPTHWMPSPEPPNQSC